MAGHSKWAQIKRKKAANDAARAKEFSKVTRMIIVAIQNGGPDPDNNPSLALAISKAKEINMPKENIERLISKFNNPDNKNRYEELTYEVYGPYNTTLLIDCATDNKNRTTTEIKSIVERQGGIFASPGAISWQYQTLGRILMEYASPYRDLSNLSSAKKKWNATLEPANISIKDSENFLLELMDLKGIEDIITDEVGIEIRTDSSELHRIKKHIESLGFKVAEAGLIKITNNTVTLTEEQLVKFQAFLQAIESVDDVQNIWHNVEEI